MTRLIIRELILSHRVVLYVYIAYGAIAAISFNASILEKGLVAPFVLMTIMFSFIPVIIIAREDKFKSGAWTCSLPVTRSRIVDARYLLSLGLIVVGLIFLFLLRTLIGILSGEGLVGVSFQTIFTALGVSVVVISVVLPLLLRYGIASILLLGGGLQVLGIVLFLIISLSDLRPSLGSLLSHILSIFSSIHASSGDTGIYITFAILIALAGWGSLLLARRLYAHREF